MQQLTVKLPDVLVKLFERYSIDGNMSIDDVIVITIIRAMYNIDKRITMMFSSFFFYNIII